MKTEYTYEEIDGGTLAITACIGKEREIILPGQIDGKPVTELSAYLFSPYKERLESADEVDGAGLVVISLPPTVKRIGNYAFYGCGSLRTLKLCDSLQDIGGGTFTGCHPSKLEIDFYEGEISVLKDILSEVHQAVEVTLHYHAGQKTNTAVLIFPQFYEEAVENTPARLLSTKFHGSGGNYRQCFHGKAVDYKEYDTLFPLAKAQEEEMTSYRLAYNRLRCPYQLGKQAKTIYETYLKETGKIVMRDVIQAEDMELLSFLTEEKCWSRDGMDTAIEESILQHSTICTGYLMEAKEILFPAETKTYTW